METFEGGIDGTRRVGIVAERSGGETLAQRVAGGRLLVEEAEEQMLEIREAAHDHTLRTVVSYAAYGGCQVTHIACERETAMQLQKRVAQRLSYDKPLLLET